MPSTPTWEPAMTAVPQAKNTRMKVPMSSAMKCRILRPPEFILPRAARGLLSGRDYSVAPACCQGPRDAGGAPARRAPILDYRVQFGLLCRGRPAPVTPAGEVRCTAQAEIGRAHV